MGLKAFYVGCGDMVGQAPVHGEKVSSCIADQNFCEPDRG